MRVNALIMDYVETTALVNGIIYSDSSVKQDLGRRCSRIPWFNSSPQQKQMVGLMEKEKLMGKKFISNLNYPESL